jgi:hypothetical protein
VKVAFFKTLFLLFAMASVAVPFASWSDHRAFVKSLEVIRPVPWTPETESQSALAAPYPPSLALDMTATIARPLFSQTRRPFEAQQELQVAQEVAQTPEPLQPPPPQMSSEGLRLMGLLDDGNIRKALISTPSQPLGVWVAISDQLEGFVVKGIENNVVTLEQQGQSVKLQQYVEKQN